MGSIKRAISAGAFVAMIPLVAMAAAPSCETPQCLKYRALLGDADAAIELANAAIKTNHEEMVRWYKVAAENGSPVGQYNYATFLVSDSKSVDDCVRALFWFKSAAASGNAYAKDYIGPLQLGISNRKYGKGCVGAIE